MSSSLWSSDRATHLRIGLVAASAALAVVLVGVHAKVDDRAQTMAQAKASRIVVKAGHPAVYSTNELQRTQ